MRNADQIRVDSLSVYFAGDPTAGIMDLELPIHNMDIYINKADKDDVNLINEFREKLKDAFEVIYGERPGIIFDFEGKEEPDFMLEK